MVRRRDVCAIVVATCIRLLTEAMDEAWGFLKVHHSGLWYRRCVGFGNDTELQVPMVKILERDQICLQILIRVRSRVPKVCDSNRIWKYMLRFYDPATMS